ncbi:MAG: hypothetical protein GWP27_08395 [Bacteroidetes bacterium]|nr:hypothetical protein [Bacteroidota bacterium]
MKSSLIIFVSLLLSLPLVAQNQVDEDGQKQGKWEKKYENGNVRYQGQFEDDQAISTFFYYYENKVKSSEVTYWSEGKASAKFFHNNGVIMGKGPYLNQQKDGDWVFFDNQAKKSMTESYVNGVLQGQSQVFYLNGQVSATFSYTDGRKDGAFKEFFPDGKVKIAGTYQDDTYDGQYVQYYQDAKVLRKGAYKAAVKDGLWVHYDTDGRIIGQELYEKGKLVKEKWEEGHEPAEEKMELEDADILNEQQLQERFLQQGGYIGN